MPQHPFADMLIEGIDQTAIPAPVASLSHRDRFVLLTDALCGSPRIRGGARPRDFPFGSARKRSLDMVGLLWMSEASHRLGTHDGSFRLIDFVVAMRLLAVARGPEEALTEVEYAGMSAAVLATLLAVLAAEGSRGLSLQRLCRTLGMNREDRRRAGVGPTPNRIGEVSFHGQPGTGVPSRVSAAKRVATVARLAEERPSVKELGRLVGNFGLCQPARVCCRS